MSKSNKTETSHMHFVKIDWITAVNLSTQVELGDSRLIAVGLWSNSETRGIQQRVLVWIDWSYVMYCNMIR
jgi:hypothetical protein